MTHAVVVAENRALTKQEVIAQKRLIQEVMESVMKQDTHYGIIPGCKQPSLFKAGSEAILSTFRIAVVPEVEDLSTSDCYRYRVTAKGVLPDGTIVGCGIGECSTDEDKYRWRGAVNDAEYNATPEDRRRIKYIKPSNWNKDGIVKQVRTNPADLGNTALKMAKKRAQIDLCLTATAASDCFTQDIEDLPEEYRDGMQEGQPQGGKPEVRQPKERQTSQAPQSGTVTGGELCTEGQVKMIHVKLRQAGLTDVDLKAHYAIEHIHDISKSAVNDVLKAIAEGIIKPLNTPAAAEPAKKEDPLPILCSDCGMPIVEGACRNLECPEGKELT